MPLSGPSGDISPGRAIVAARYVERRLLPISHAFMLGHEDADISSNITSYCGARRGITTAREMPVLSRDTRPDVVPFMKNGATQEARH